MELRDNLNNKSEMATYLKDGIVRLLGRGFLHIEDQKPIVDRGGLQRGFRFGEFVLCLGDAGQLLLCSQLQGSREAFFRRHLRFPVPGGKIRRRITLICVDFLFFSFSFSLFTAAKLLPVRGFLRN